MVWKHENIAHGKKTKYIKKERGGGGGGGGGGELGSAVLWLPAFPVQPVKQPELVLQESHLLDQL